MGEEKRLLKTEEVWDRLGRDRVGREAVYSLMRRYGVRLGKRLLLPARILDDLLEGRLELEKTPRGGARG